MYKFLSKYGQALGFAIGAIITVIFLLNVFYNAEEFSALSEEDQMQSSIFNFGLYGAIALIALCAVAALIAGIVLMIMNPKGSLKTIIGLIVILIIFAIGYYNTNPEGAGSLAQTILEEGVQEGASRFISGAITTALSLGGLAVVMIVVAELVNIFR